MDKPKILTENNFTELAKQYQYTFSPGDIVAGIIYNIEKKGILVDIGTFKLAYLPEQKILSKMPNNNKSLGPLQVNEIHEFLIVAENKVTQQVILSLKKLHQIRGWQRIKQLANEDLIINASPVKINNGGMIVYIEGIKGFIPNSHIPAYLQKYGLLHQTLPLKILEINKAEKQLILSYKNVLIRQLKKNFKIGDSLLGRIKTIKSYGLLIDIKGIIGLLHISEIKNLKDKNLNRIFKINQSIEVTCLHINSKDGKLMLSTKRI